MTLASLQYLTAISAKETRTLLRSRRAFWMLILTLVAVGGMFLLTLMNSGGLAGAMGRTRFSRLIFTSLAYVQLLVMGLVTPLMTATAFTTEREHKTLDLLYGTPIPRLYLILGKWLAAIVYQFAILICLLPVLALTFQLGGVGLDEYLYVAVVIGLAVVAYGMIGVTISIKASDSMHAMRTAGGFLILLHLGFYLVGIIFMILIRSLSSTSFVARSVMPILVSFSPLYTISVINASSAGLFLKTAFFYHVAFQLFLTAVSALIALGALRGSETLKPVIAKKLIDDPIRLQARRYGFPFYLFDPLRRPQSIGDRQNPLLIKERRIGGAGRLDNTIRFAYAGLLISFPMLTLVEQNSLAALSHLTIAGLCFTAISAPALTATLITREREEATLGLLLNIPGSAWRIVWAKWRSVLRPLAVRALSIMPIALVTQFLYDRQFGETASAMLKNLPFLASFVMLYAAVGVCCSAICRRNISAIVATLLMMVLMVSSPLLLGTLAIFSPGYGRMLLGVTMHACPFVSPFTSFHQVFVVDPLQNTSPYDTTWPDILIRAAVVASLTLFLLFIASRRLSARRDDL